MYRNDNCGLDLVPYHREILDPRAVEPRITRVCLHP